MIRSKWLTHRTNVDSGFGGRSRIKNTPCKRRTVLGGELLEQRLTLTTATFTALTGNLNIVGDNVGIDDDILIVDVQNNQVRVRDLGEVNPVVNITNGPVAPGLIQSITITSQGGQDFIDLSAVTATAFTNIPTNPPPGVFPVTVDSGGSDDVVIGSAFDDDIDGAGGNDELHGGGGDDHVDGGTNSRADFLFGDAGNDTLLGGASNDWLDGGTGTDTLNGGAGDDTYAWSGSGAGGLQNDVIVEGGGNDTMSFQGWSRAVTLDLSGANLQTVSAGFLSVNGIVNIENVIGGNSGDTLTGDAGANIIDGGLGDDDIDAGLGADRIAGGQGDDTVDGEGGADVVSGDGYGNRSQLGTLASPDPTATDDLGNPAPVLNEASGLIHSRRNSSILWSVEDSGNGADLLAHTTSGASRGWFRLVGVANTDFEDLGYYFDAGTGTRYIYVADIGDNGDARGFVSVFRFAEPAVTGTGNGFRGTIATANIQEMRVRYPGGARDAETLMVDPNTGDVVIASKNNVGGGATNAELYSITAANQNWTAVGGGGIGTLLTFDGLLSFNLENGAGPVGGVPPSSGDISNDGTQIVIMSEREIHRFVRRPGRTVQQAILTDGLVEVVNPFQVGDREAIAFDTQMVPGIYTTSEGLVGPNDTNTNSQTDLQRVERYTRFGGDDFLWGDSNFTNVDNDVIFGGGGDDSAYGGAGNDIIFGDFPNPSAYGGYGSIDHLFGMDGDDEIHGGAGNDNLSGGNNDDTINGDDGNDTVRGDHGADTLFGDGGTDTIYARTNSTDSQTTFDGIDNLFGGSGVDTLFFNLGEDFGTP